MEWKYINSLVNKKKLKKNGGYAAVSKEGHADSVLGYERSHHN